MRMFGGTKGPALLSHLEIAKQVSGQESKSLINTSTGKFYTPPEIGVPMAQQVCKILARKNKEVIEIIDPFAGDGRLVVWLIENLLPKHPRLRITLWDYDEAALRVAEQNVTAAAKNAGIDAVIFAERRNSFDKTQLEKLGGVYDVVITNPPWDVVKPDKNELETLDAASKESYIRSLKEFTNYLVDNFPLSKPRTMYAGWGVNLARTGTELSFDLACMGGVVAVVSPATLLADQNSYALRRYLLEKTSCKSIDIYPAEMRLFKSVDQPSISFVLTKTSKPADIDVAWHSKTDAGGKGTHAKISQQFLRDNDFVVPVNFVINDVLTSVLKKLRQLKTISDLEADPEFKLWTGRELDETGFTSWVSPSGKTRFIKGVSIDRYHIHNEDRLYIRESSEKKLPSTIDSERIGWRDVTRPSQKRRMIATILPPHYVTGNSVGVAKLGTGIKNGDKKLRALLASMSSYVFEFQARLLLATAHVSQGVVRKIAVPDLNDEGFISRASDLVAKIEAGKRNAELELEVLVARAYGLDPEEMGAILAAFHKVTQEEKRDIIMAMTS